ncbi:uncharacterized protein LOC131628094 [Vicia villosa]|uniref:uncharacterized protein LOC131628094 n=1 Tax=Vicia villosa TaxID=3911 RepID=UPI00273CD6BD|nr:uncharacterized protein LOC131628094 [Vicia villosa]
MGSPPPLQEHIPISAFLIAIGVLTAFFIILVIFARLFRLRQRQAVARIIRERVSESTFDSSASPHAQIQCAICVYEFKTGDTLHSLPCGHALHKQCMFDFILKSAHVCPNCRATF